MRIKNNHARWIMDMGNSGRSDDNTIDLKISDYIMIKNGCKYWVKMRDKHFKVC